MELVPFTAVAIPLPVRQYGSLRPAPVAAGAPDEGCGAQDRRREGRLVETSEVAYTAAGLELVGTIAFPDPADGPLPGLLIAHEGLDLLPFGAPREQFYRRRRHATAPAARTTAAPAMSRNASGL